MVYINHEKLYKQNFSLKSNGLMYFQFSFLLKREYCQF